MTSTHLYYAEKSDVESIYELAIEYKNVDLSDADYPDIDRNKLINFINTMLKKGKIMLMKDLEKDKLIACCMFNKSEYFFSKNIN